MAWQDTAVFMTTTHRDSHQLAWEWNWIRQSLVEDSLRFASMGGEAQDSELAEFLTELGASGLQSASQLSRALRDAGLSHVRVLKPLQWFYRRHIEKPSSDVEALALARVTQWRLLRRMGDALESKTLPACLDEAVQQVINSGRQTIERLTLWLEKTADGEDRLKQYREVDREVIYELRPFEEDLSKIPGLGRESLEPSPAIS